MMDMQDPVVILTSSLNLLLQQNMKVGLNARTAQTKKIGSVRNVEVMIRLMKNKGVRQSHASSRNSEAIDV